MAMRGMVTRVGLMAMAMIAHSALAAEVVQVPSNPIPTATGARPAPAPLSGKLSLPGSGGPYPVVILLHGCGGLGTGANMERWADRLNAWGYAAFVLDSFKARNIRSVCAPEDQPKVSPLDRSGDVLNAAMALGAHAHIDANRIGVIGFSHGGATAVTVTRRAFEHDQPHLIKASVNYYGPCRQPEFHGTTPLLSLNGDADNWGDPAATCAAFGAAMRPDQIAQLHTYQGVVHNFDNPDVTPRRTVLGHPAQFDWTAAHDSYERTRAFLNKYLGDGVR